MEDKVKLLLKEYGLKEKEIKVYLFLVGRIRQTAYKIAKELGLHQSTTYDILRRLVERGFVQELTAEETTYYRSNEVNVVISRLKAKENILESILPELGKMKITSDIEIRVFKGKAEARELSFYFMDLLDKGYAGDILICGDSLPISGLLSILEKTLSGKNYKSDLSFKGLWPSNKKDNEAVKLYKKFGENRFLKNIPSATVTTIVIGIFTIFVLGEYGERRGIVIKNKLISLFMKSQFNLLWEMAEKDS